MNNDSNHTAVLKRCLLKIEEELSLLSLWFENVPTPKQLASNEPFSLDTLSFPEWLQFIFLPRMRHMLEQGLDLPKSCQIAPMAEEYFAQGGVNTSNLIALIKELDSLFPAPDETELKQTGFDLQGDSHR